MTSPRTQLIPGQFIADFFSHTCLNLSQPATYLPAVTQSYFYVPIYNLLLAFAAFFYLIFCAVLLLRILFTTKPLPHERLSRTKLVSTVRSHSML